MPASDKSYRLFVILNPVAGHYHAESTEKVFREIFDRQNIRYDIYQTTGHENLVEVVQAARRENYSAIIAVGGDGTVSGVAGGLVNSDTPLGILPVGTGNLFARELGIPLDLTTACRLLVDQPACIATDAMQVENEIHLPHVSLGLYAYVIEKTRIEEKRRFGRMAYIWRALQELSGRKSWNFSLKVDNRPVRARASLIMLANIGATGVGDVRWGKGIRPNDGIIDICIVRARSPKDFLMTVWQLIRRQPQPATIIYLQAQKEVAITVNRPIPIRLKDETIERRHLTVKVLPAAVKVIVPGILV